MASIRLTPEEIASLRTLYLELDAARLEVAQAEHRVRAFLLSLERKYGLWGKGAELDPTNGAIVFREEPGDGRAPGGQDGN